MPNKQFFATVLTVTFIISIVACQSSPAKFGTDPDTAGESFHAFYQKMGDCDFDCYKSYCLTIEDMETLKNDPNSPSNLKGLIEGFLSNPKQWENNLQRDYETLKKSGKNIDESWSSLSYDSFEFGKDPISQRLIGKLEMGSGEKKMRVQLMSIAIDGKYKLFSTSDLQNLN